MSKYLFIAHQKSRNIYFLCSENSPEETCAADHLIDYLRELRSRKTAASELDERNCMELLYNWIVNKESAKCDEKMARIFTDEWKCVSALPVVDAYIVAEVSMHMEE